MNTQPRNLVIPSVVEEDGKVTRTWDIFSRLLKDRVIMLHDQVNDATASLVTSQLLFLNSENRKDPIYLYINSPGGSITAGMAIYDTMQYITAPVHTIAMGMAASMGAFLLSAGEPGHRYCLPNADVMIHQPLGGYQGQATDMEIHTKRILKMKKDLVTKMANSTNGKTDYKKMLSACERDNYLTAQEALDMGLIDQIITKEFINKED